MKKLLFTISIWLFISCSSTSISHLSTEEFITHVNDMDRMNSAYWTSYIGETDNRIYLEYGTMISSFSKTRTIVYWTEKDKIPKQIIEKLKR